MSIQAGYLDKPATPLFLPAPKVQFYVPVDGAGSERVAEYIPSTGGVHVINLVRRVKVTVPGIPTGVLTEIDKYAPQVELLRYVRRRSSDRASSGNGSKTAAYVHPSHGPGASGNGSYTHGGDHGGVDVGFMGLRETEWNIVDGSTAIDVTRGMWAFMCWADDMAYRDSTGNTAQFSGVYPSEVASQRRRLPGRRFPYTAAYTPGYFAFRISVRDITDPRGKRIHGPASQTVRLVNEKFPFTPAGLDIGGRAQADLRGEYDSERGNAFFVTRLP